MKLLRWLIRKLKYLFQRNTYVLLIFLLTVKVMLDFNYFTNTEDLHIEELPVIVDGIKYNHTLAKHVGVIKKSAGQAANSLPVNEIFGQLLASNQTKHIANEITGIGKNNTSSHSQKTLHQNESIKLDNKSPQTQLVSVDEAAYYKINKDKVVNLYTYNYTILPSKRICTNDTSLVILVHSLGEYHKGRKAIRDTWGSLAYTSKPTWPPGDQFKYKIGIVFVTALQDNNTWNEQLLREAETYGDILQGNFKDAYRNMTLKSLLGLKYVSEFCSMVPYMVKCDDDMFINIPFLLDSLFVGRKLGPRSILGPFNGRSRVDRVGQWGVSTKDFPFKFYPPYESGAMYVITVDIVHELYNTSHYVPYFFVDDAYVTGVLAKVIGAKHARANLFAYWGSPKPQPCDIVLRKKISFTKSEPKHKYYLWNALQSNLHCKK